MNISIRKCHCGAWMCRGCQSCSSDCGCEVPNIPCDCWFKEEQVCDICQGCPTNQPVRCTECKSPIFVRANGTIVPHWNPDGNKCAANERHYLKLIKDRGEFSEATASLEAL